MNTCPNCGHEIADDVRRCPRCGAEVNSVWPPAPEGSPREDAPPRRDGGRVGSGVGLGCLLSGLLYVVLGPVAFMAGVARRFPRGYPGFHVPWVFRYGTWTINLVPLALVGLLFFALRPRYPRFARGLGYCLIVIAVLLLWGLASCRQ